MVYTQVWTLALQDSPAAVCQWGPDHLFIAYRNGLLEVRSKATGDVAAQGYSPFDAHGGSGGAAISCAGYCANGIGVVVCQLGGLMHVVATVRVDIANQAMDVGQTFDVPVFPDYPERPAGAASVTTQMRDGAQLGWSYDNAALATTPTGGMLLIPVTDRGRVGGVQRAPGQLGAWFDVDGPNSFRWTALRAEIGSTPGKYIAVIRGGLRALSATKFHTALQEYDRDAPMPVPVPAPDYISFGEYIDVTHNGPAGAVANLVPFGDITIRNPGGENT